MAAGILKRMYAESSITGVVESAGTMDWNVGKPADERAIAVARENGVDIRAHRARQVHTNDYSKFELIIAMDQQNATALLKAAPPACRHKIRLLLENADIADPYHGDIALFRATYRVIEKCCLEMFRRE